MENMSTNVLVTGAGAPGAPGIIKALREKGIYTIFSCDVVDETAGKHLSDGYFTVPRGDNENYIEELLNNCINHKINIVFPITTKELIPLSKHKDVFRNKGIEIIVSDYTSLNIANNKGLLYKHLASNGIPTPEFYITNTFDQFKEACQNLRDKHQAIIFKPTEGNGSRGFRVLDDNTDEFDLLFNHKPSSTYISYTKALELLSEKDFPELVVSEYLPGKEYTVDCLLTDGNINAIIPRLRTKMNNGISVAGTIEQNSDVIEYCEAILKSLKLTGPIGIQVRYSTENKPLLVEINPRIQGTTVACIGAGINIASLAVQQIISPSNSFTVADQKIKWGTRFIRHYSEVFF